MPDSLDPRITVMPDGSYFYSGSVVQQKPEFMPSYCTFFSGQQGRTNYVGRGEYGKKVFDYGQRHNTSREEGVVVDTTVNRIKYSASWVFANLVSDVTLRDVVGALATAGVPRSKWIKPLPPFGLHRTGYGILMIKVHFNEDGTAYINQSQAWTKAKRAFVPMKDGVPNWSRAIFITSYADMGQQDYDEVGRYGVVSEVQAEFDDNRYSQPVLDSIIDNIIINGKSSCGSPVFYSSVVQGSYSFRISKENSITRWRFLKRTEDDYGHRSSHYVSIVD